MIRLKLTNFYKNRHMKYLIFILTFVIFFTLSCSKDIEFRSIKLSGVLNVQSASTYQYGTHILTDNSGNLTYALRSKTETLDKYIGKNVEITGHKVKGYPVDGGPEYLEVTKIK